METTGDRSVGGGGEAFEGESSELSGGLLDRRTGLDRRSAPRFATEEGDDVADRRQTPRFSTDALEESESGGDQDLDRRRGAGRRLSDFTRSAEEGEFTKEQFLFVQAVQAFKRANGKPYPAWTDVLEVIRLLGYRKTMRSEIEMRNAEDWLEAGDTPSGVRPKGWERRGGRVGRGRGEAA